MKLIKKASLITLIFIYIFLSFYRITNVNNKEISWDVLGYYLYLPATFIYHDPMLNNISWLEKINEEKHLSGTLYMVSSNDEGEPMYFFLMGMSLFYLPFFLIGHLLAGPLGFEANGFSIIYQYSLVVGCIIYTLIGLYYLRKNLLSFFTDGITAIVMLIFVFGTNYIHHLTLKNLEPVTILFMLVNIILWNTIQWHKTYQFKNLLVIGSGITLMGLTKPSEVMVIFLPLFWEITSYVKFKQKMKLIWVKRKSFFYVIGFCVLIVSPQILYWWFKTGHLIYDSYKNPGVGLDFFSPHIADVLFSYRKGWLLYTPVMIFSLMGFVNLYKRNKTVFYAFLFYFLTEFWVISSWTEWWYGSGFSNRPLITVYPILAISFGYFLTDLIKTKRYILLPVSLVIVFFVFLNEFQWWQAKHYLLPLYRNTKAYYWANFLKTKVDPKNYPLMSIYRNFDGEQAFSHPERYDSLCIINLTMDEPQFIMSMINEFPLGYYHFNNKEKYFQVMDSRYGDLSSADHLWFKASIDVRFPNNFEGDMPRMVFHMMRKEGIYGYFSGIIQPILDGEWHHYNYDFLTPELRSHNDHLKCYVWKRSEIGFDIDNFKVIKFEPKKNE